MTFNSENIVNLIEQLRSTESLSSQTRTLLESALSRLLELESDFNNALEREKLAALKEFAYGASHEINNPLANISTRAQSMLAEEKHPERRRKLATIVTQAMRAHEMISDLMLFAKPPTPRFEQVELLPIIRLVVSELQQEASDQEIEIITNVEPQDLSLMADRTQLAVAIKALVRNALEAMQSGGKIEVAAIRQASDVIICVRDDGPGMAAETRKHIFDPFYSGREAGRGLGFGLPKCWRIAELHGGRIEVASELGVGSTFSLVLPLHPAQVAT